MSYAWLVGVATVAVAIATIAVFYATLKVAEATRAVAKSSDIVGQSQIRPFLWAYLREKEKGLGIYVRNDGFGTSDWGKVTIQTLSGFIPYPLAPIMAHTAREIPQGEQPKISLSGSEKVVTVSIEYADVNGRPYSWKQDLSLEGWK